MESLQAVISHFTARLIDGTGLYTLKDPQVQDALHLRARQELSDIQSTAFVIALATDSIFDKQEQV